MRRQAYLLGSVVLIFPLLARAQAESGPSSIPASAPVSQPVPTSQPVSQPASAPGNLAATLPTSSSVEPSTSLANKVAQEGKEKKSPKELAAGLLGRVRFGGLLQGWYDTNNQAEKFGPNDEIAGTFRIRRAELKISGDIIPQKFSFTVSTDLAKALFKSDPVLIENPDGTTTEVGGVKEDNILPVRDLYGVIKTEYVDLKMGQFKIPVSLAGNTSSSRLILPERAQISKKLGDKRDIGVQVEKKEELYAFRLGLFNGAGENRLDKDTSKNLAARFALTPKFGASGKLLLGAVGLQTLGPEGQAKTTELEGDARVELGPLLLQGEVIGIISTSAADAQGESSVTRGMGFYVMGAYTYQGRVQVAARFGVFDPDQELAAAADPGQLSEISLALNYFFLRDKDKKSENFTDHAEYHQAKLQLGYSRYIPTLEAADPADAVAPADQVILALQSAF